MVGVKKRYDPTPTRRYVEDRQTKAVTLSLIGDFHCLGLPPRNSCGKRSARVRSRENSRWRDKIDLWVSYAFCQRSRILRQYKEYISLLFPSHQYALLRCYKIQSRDIRDSCPDLAYILLAHTFPPFLEREISFGLNDYRLTSLMSLQVQPQAVVGANPSINTRKTRVAMKHLVNSPVSLLKNKGCNTRVHSQVASASKKLSDPRSRCQK